MKTKVKFFFIAAMATAANVAMADDFSLPNDLKISGFTRITAGKVVSGSGLDGAYSGSYSINGVTCPCYTADWANGGVYGHDLTLSPESIAGIQANYSLTSNTNVVGQAVYYAATGKAELTWAYLTHKLNPNWEVSLGRKRIPLYYYSDSQDISLSYPWISPTPELYGWEATNYNGASIRFNKEIAGIGVNASVFLGNEKVSDSPYYKLNYTGDTTVHWDGIRGADLELSKGAATLRGIYMRADTHATNSSVSLNDSAAMEAYGVALNVDYESWFILSEVAQQKRVFSGINPYSYRAPAYSAGVGMRFGKWTPFINYADYSEHSSDLSLYTPQSYRRTSLTMRYDFNSSSAIKAQIDRNIDATQNFGGNTSVFRLSYDKVF